MAISENYNPVEIAFWILHAIKELEPTKLEFLKSGDRYFIDLLFGSSLLRESLTNTKWQNITVDFQTELIY
ncbi:MAG TPA: hypothetical protein ENK21_06085 [Trueperaceae bacterium]|nr:hypothetical protein [Trueperaceae bacterium]